MTFEILTIRDVGCPFDFLYPSPGATTNTIVPEQDDGTTSFVAVNGTTASSQINGQKFELARLEGIKASLIITDARVAVACTHFKRGGMPIRFGGAAGQVLSGVGDLISSRIARASTSGTAVVGHVRYDWLRAVIARDRKGWGSENQLQFIFIEPETKAASILMVQLERKQRASGIAELVVPRWMRWKAHSETDEMYITRLAGNALRPASTITPSSGTRLYELPTR